VQRIGAVFAGVAVVWLALAPFFWEQPGPALATAAAFLAATLSAVVLARRGRSRSASWILVATVWAGATIEASIGSGPSSAALGTHVVAILAAGLLLGPYPAVAVTILSALVEAALLVLAERGALPQVLPRTLWTHWWIVVSINACSAALLLYVLGRLRSALGRAARSEGRARELFERAGDAIFVVGSEGRVVEANAAACDLFAAPLEELARRPLGELLGGEGGDGAPLGDETSILERTLRRRDGSERSLECSFRRLSDGRTEIIARDVTARRTLEARYRALVEQALVGVCLIQGNRIVYANPRLAEIMRRTPEELCALPSLLHLFPPEDRAGFAERMERKRFLVEGRAADEIRLLRGDGTIADVQAFATLGRFEGKPSVVSVTIDVSERAEAERVGVRLRSALDQTLEAIVVFDENGRLVYANPAFARLYGHAEPMAAMTAKDVAERPLREQPASKLSEAIRSGKPWSGRYERVAPDGERSIREGSIGPVRGPSGELIGHVGLIRDVTREVDLATELREAQKLEAIGRLAGGVAHDFSNFLTVIVATVEELAGHLPADPVVQRALEDVRAVTGRAESLTRELLVLGRRRPTQTQRLDLNEAVEEAGRMLKRMLPAVVSLEVRRAPEPALIEADPDQIRQCLLNLALNARDAMPHGGALELSVASRRVGAAGERGFRVAPGPYVELLVRDTGQGMDDETRERIFEPFFSTKDAQRGSGLGLALVRGIVEQGGGGIHVDSASGKGSTFRILWPAAGGALQAERPAAPPAREGAPPSVLLVDDDEVVRRFMLRCLEGAGLRVLAAADAEQALELASAAEEPLGLLVTDIVLPRLDGSSLARRLRERWPGLRVLYTSGYGRGAPEPPGSAPSAMLAKPFTPAQLQEAVRSLLAR